MYPNYMCLNQEYPYKPPIDTGLALIYQDEYLLAVNKPSGLLSVPGRGEDKQDCMLTRLQLKFPEALVIHRLDMCTSGLMLMARNKQMQSRVSLLFQNRKVRKTYIAIVDGLMPESQGEIDLPLSKDWPNRPRQRVDFIHGKPSTTRYRVRSRNTLKNTTCLELMPETGRSHQLRVHLLALGHAIVGDQLYANQQRENKDSRLMLHATSLSFRHPISLQEITLKCELPFNNQ